MQTVVVTVLISIAQVIGYIFLVIAGYYLILARGFTGEYAMGFGIGLVYGGTILFISSLVALFFKQYGYFYIFKLNVNLF